MKQVIILTIIITTGIVGLMAFKTIQKLKGQLIDAQKAAEYWEKTEETGSAYLEKQIDEQKDFINALVMAKIPGKFEYKNIMISRTYQYDSSDNYQTVTITGEVVNNLNIEYETASFGVSIYDEHDMVLDTHSFVFESIEKGQTKPFKVTFLGVRSSRPAIYCKIYLDSVIPKK